MHYVQYAIDGITYDNFEVLFSQIWKEAKNKYGRDTWKFNKYIWENWFCKMTGGNPDLGGYPKALDAQFETFVKGVTSWNEANCFARTNLMYFTAEEINRYWTCGTSGFSFSRNSSNEKERFTSVVNKSIDGNGGTTGKISKSNGYTTVTVGNKKYKVMYQGSEGELYRQSGCSITSEAIVLSAYKPELKHTAKSLHEKFGATIRGIEQIAGDLTGMGVKSKSYVSFGADKKPSVQKTAITNIKNNLSKGKPVIILVRSGPDACYTSNAHYMVLVGYNESGKPIIIDPGKGSCSEKHTVEQLVKNYIYAPSDYEQGYVLIN